jgi:4-hydroxybenzoate polyprenyltransferase
VVAAFLLFAISVNHLVNLAGDPRRPLVVAAATRRQMRIVAGVAAVVALGGGIAAGGPTLLVIVGGLAFATAYSIPRGGWRAEASSHHCCCRSATSPSRI